MNNVRRGFDRIAILIACAWLIFSAIYSPYKVTHRHADAERRMSTAKAGETFAVESAESRAQRDLARSEDTLKAARQRLVQEQQRLQKTNEDLSKAKTDLATFSHIFAQVTAQAQRFNAEDEALFKRLRDEEAREDASGWYFRSDGKDANGANGAEVKKSLEKETEAKSSELCAAAADTITVFFKEMPQSAGALSMSAKAIRIALLLTSSNDFDERSALGRRELESLVREREFDVQQCSAGIDTAKREITKAEFDSSEAANLLKTKAWYPDIQHYESEITFWQSNSRWSITDFGRMALYIILPIVGFLATYRVIFTIVAWIVRGFRTKLVPSP